MKLLIAAWALLAAGNVAAQAGGPADVQAGAQAATQWVTLGTLGGVRPSPTRAQPANLLLHGGRAILIDAGDGTTRQLAAAGVPLGQVEALLLSHYHFDHIGGVAAILGARFQTKAPRLLAVYGPPGTREIVDGILASMGPSARSGDGIPGSERRDPAALVTVRELGDGETFAIGDVTVRTAQNSHYSFAPGSADDKAMKSLSYRFDVPGRSIVYTGDTGPSAKVEALGKGADLLVSEMIDLDATLAQIRQSGAERRGGGERRGGRPGGGLSAEASRHLAEQHLTPEAVGRMAKAMGVREVVLTHLVVGAADEARLAQDVATIRRSFAGPVRIANDLDRF